MSKKAKVGHSRLGPRQTFVLAQLRIQPNNLWYYGCGWGYARRRDMESILDALHNKGLVTLHYDEQESRSLHAGSTCRARTSMNTRSMNRERGALTTERRPCLRGMGKHLPWPRHLGRVIAQPDEAIYDPK